MGSFWRVIVPEAATNHIKNPSFEENVSDGWTLEDAGAGAAVEQRPRAYVGAYSAKLTAGDAACQLKSNDITLADDETLYLQAQVWTETPSTGKILIYDVTNTTVHGEVTASTVGAWELMKTSWKNETGGSVTVVAKLRNSAGDSASRVWFDSVQAEIDASSYTTYIDGNQPGCEWLGEPHNSTSQRSGQSRAGGRVYDLEDYHFFPEGASGIGAPPVEHDMQEYALLPGGEVADYKLHPRTFTVQGYIDGSSYSDLLANRQALLSILSPSSHPGNQPVTLRFCHAVDEDPVREIRARYISGLEYRRGPDDGFREKNVDIQFEAADPLWTEIGQSAQVLDTNDSYTFRYIAARLRSTGQWSALGLAAHTTAAAVYAAAFNPVDGKYYIGGDFTGWGGVAGRDYVARYDPEAGAWETVVGASDVGDVVRCIVVAPNGDVFFGGDFLNVNSVAANDYIVQYDLSADDWLPLGTPSSAVVGSPGVWAMALCAGGLVVGGDFEDWAGTANRNYVALWNGSAWSTVGAVSDGTGRVAAIVVDSQDNYYLAGAFTNWDGDGDADYLVKWDGTAWAPLSTSDVFTSANNGLVIGDDDVLYVLGGFSNHGDANGDGIVSWNGTAYSSLGEGLDVSGGNDAFTGVIGPDGLLYVVGAFLKADGITLSQRVAVWNGSSWNHLDVDLPGSPTVSAVCVGPVDAQVPTNYDLWLGFNTTGAGTAAGTATVTNDGTADAYPTIVVERVGGTLAKLTSIRNETTGKTLLFNYALYGDEVLTIDLASKAKSISSNIWGPRWSAARPACDVGEFALQPGDNQITAFVDTAGSPTITAYMLWRDTYLSAD